ncbi:hypothetical protein LS73_008195 [Helicobacter muridarum]|uniref:Helicase, Snf2 family n=1 Tax=Helicobacter muridarum TaxID=216 RepID=A0A099TZI4_9HELI|nr:SNF2-related protein [Helicobacter muridarum]TLD98796.1 hypothetical protein LS73_008195 [Helicobacter muridarum]STQ85773.1 helicase, Snf2 family [Helicobacter muridarum]
MDSLKLLKDILENPRVLNDSEKEILSNFRGFGKASNELFKNIKEKGEAYRELESLLNSLSEHLGEKITPLDMLKRASDAFYTPMPIIREMVSLAQSFGLKEGHYVLEPSVGVGRFLSELSNKGLNIHGIEIDSISAKLASLIYPNVKINKSGFEKSKYAINDFYDLVIGNPPYGNFIIKDSNFRATAHNYFMKKGIDNLAENGISIQIVTHNFMDAKDKLTRAKIAENAAFMGGVRLPNTAFKDAKVTTDILVFRKAGKGEKLDNSWIETTDFNGMQVSKYFLDNPQNVLGNMQVGKGQFGDVIEVVNKDFDINSLKLQEYIKHDNLALTTHKSNRESLLQEVEEANKAKEFIGENSPLVLKDNEIYRHGNIINVEAELKELTDWSESTITQRAKALKDMLPDINNVRETLSKLQNAEREGLEYETIEALRKDLNTQYQKLVGKNSSFYNKNGAISQKFKAYEMLDDESFELFALEKKAIVNNDKVVGAIKSDIFTKRVNYPYIAPQSANNLNEAVAITLNETGSYNYGRIAELLGKDIKSVKKELLDNKIHYLDNNGEHIEKEAFLSGDVKTRLESFHDENGLPKFSEDESIRKYQEIAYNDLKNVIPDDIELPLVNIPLGANWLDKNITDSFLRDVLESNIETSYIHGVGWNFKYDKGITTGRDLTIATSDKFREQTGISTIDGAYYLEDMFNNKTLKVQKTIFSKEKPNAVTYTDPIASQSLESMKKQLSAEFKNFILENESFTDIAQKQYNDTFNRIVQRKYDGSHIQLIGKNADISMREHQNNAIFRFLQENSTLLAHDVGTGKSYTMVASSIEAKRIGIIKKPMIVVPNNVAPQLAAEARRLYPNAKIQLVQAVSKKDKNKQLARIKNNDNDITITTYTAFTNMNISPSYFERYIQNELKYIDKIIEKLAKDPNTPKRVMNAALNKRDKLKEKLENYIQEIENEKQNLFFDDLGIDSLMFDEAHYLKNLPIQTAQRNVRGIGAANSQRALDAMMKVTHVFDNDKGKVLFATGTPITNFISDVYVLQRFLSPKGLESAGIEHFDEWCKQFAGAASEFELKATGDYKLTTRLRDFTNLPELKNQYLQFADVVTKDDMKKAAEKQGIKNLEPEIERINVVIDKNSHQAEFMELIKKRAEKIEQNKRASMEKGSDNMLKIISDSNKASLDMRLIDRSLERDSNGKIAQSANNIYQNYKQYDNVKGTQLVFLDTSVPKKKVSPKKIEKLGKELKNLQKRIDELEELGDFEKVENLSKKKEDLEIQIEQYKDGFSVYDDLKEVLIEKGIKENEIAFIHDYQAEGNSKWSKNVLREKINSGEIRVLIGSTGKMGAGSNFQERLVALHHLDLNWTPANMEQREGRIIRQGNRLIDEIPNFKAKIYTYVTKEMSDALMLQTLEQKQKIIKQIQDPNLKARFVEDTSEDNLHGRLKAMASPNAEQHLEFMGLQKELDLLNNTIATSKNIVANNTRKIKEAQDFLARNSQKLEYLKEFIKDTKDNDTLSINAKTWNLKEDKKAKKDTKENDKQKTKSKEKENDVINQALAEVMKDFARNPDKMQIIGTYKGKNLMAYKASSGVEMLLGDDLKNSFPLNKIDLKQAYYDELNYLTRLNNGYTRLIKGDYASVLEGQIYEKETQIAKSKKALEREKGNDLSQTQKLLEERAYRQKELAIFLGMGEQKDHEFMEAVLGEYYKKIIHDKINAEKEGLDIESNKEAKNVKETQADIHKHRQETKEALETLLNKDIINNKTGLKAQVSSKSLAKMLSTTAINKSVANGFSELEHIQAVQNIQKLYENATLKETTKDKSGANNLLIHRFNSPFNDNNVLITIKETTLGKTKGNKIYSVELELIEQSAPTHSTT